jgi:SAM-dependent methyltransferase
MWLFLGVLEAAALQLTAPAQRSALAPNGVGDHVFLALNSASGKLWNVKPVVNHPGGRRICKMGNVEVLETSAGSDRRTMVFANEEKSAVEAVVECEGDGRCEADCTPCACTARMESPARLGTNYHRVIATQLATLCGGGSSRVLLVGLGGSVLTQYLADNCPEMRIDVFEISPDVVEAAQSFFGLRECREQNPGRIGVSTVDAAVGLSELAAGGQGLELAEGFVNGTDAYDAVVIDCFVGEGKIPDACRSRETLDKVRGILRPGGSLLQNAWGRSLQLPEVEQDFSTLTEDYRSAFSQFEDLHVPMPPQVDFVHILKGTK